MESDYQHIQQQVLDAYHEAKHLNIYGMNSKAFYGLPVTGQELDMSGYKGISHYEPTELFITAKAGTSLLEIEETLAKSGQQLAFEPPRFNNKGSIGGAVAAGLSGPARPYTGSLRDFVLGISCINGKGHCLNFGGQVMKNVAGYDVSRLLSGSLGTLAILLEVTLKVLPEPKYEASCEKKMSLASARKFLRELKTKSALLSGAVYDGEHLRLRFSGNRNAIDEAMNFIQFDTFDNSEWWELLRDHQHDFFQSDKNIWRLSIPFNSEPKFIEENFLMDWGGTQYWIASNKAEEEMFELARNYGGHATLFYDKKNTQKRFQPLSNELLNIHKRMKQAFDPKFILNPGKMYAEL